MFELKFHVSKERAVSYRQRAPVEKRLVPGRHGSETNRGRNDESGDTGEDKTGTGNTMLF